MDSMLNLLEYAEVKLRELCNLQGRNWDGMTNDGKLEFIYEQLKGSPGPRGRMGPMGPRGQKGLSR